MGKRQPPPALVRTRCIVALLLLLSLATRSRGQALVYPEWEDYLAHVIERIDDEDEANDCFLRLTILHENPISLNNSTVDQLLQIPSLNKAAIEQIHSYIYTSGTIQSFGELRLIPGLSTEMIQALMLFTYIGEESSRWKPVYKNKWKTSADWQTNIPFYYRKGYVIGPAYAGDPLYHRFRTETKYDKWQLGFHMEKDPGEHYFDSYGGFVMRENWKQIKRLIVGDFRVHFAQGLTIGSSSQFGMGSMVTQPAQGVRPMRGTDEYNFMRGIAGEWSATKASGTYTILGFASWRKMDATAHLDGGISSLRRDGYHRTQTELDAKRSAGVLSTGARLHWQKKLFSLGASANYQHLDKYLFPSLPTGFSGSDFAQFGADYSFEANQVRMAGEVAFSTDRKAWATVHRLTWTPRQNFQCTLLPRYYGAHYHALFSSAPISSGSTSQNETGATVQVVYQPFEGIKLNGFADMAYHAQPRFNISEPDHLYRTQLDGEVHLSDKHTLTLSYRWKKGMEMGDHLRRHNQTRLQWQWAVAKCHDMHTSLMTHHAIGKIGWGITQRWQFHTPNEQWKGMLVLTYFNTPSYHQRIYTYEPTLLSNFASGALFGQGLRGAAKLQWKHHSGHYMVQAKLSSTYRHDTKEQGSGNELILGHWKNDASILVQVKF